MDCRQFDDLLALSGKERRRGNQDPIRPLSGKRGKAALKFAFRTGPENMTLQTERTGCLFHVAQLNRAIWRVRVYEHGDHSRLRKQFAKHAQSLRFQCDAQKAHARCVSAGTVEAGDKPERYRVRAGDEYNWNGRGRRFRRHCRRRIPDNDCYLTLYEFGDNRRELFALEARPAVFDGHVLSLDKTNFPQSLTKRAYKRRRFAGGCALACVEKPDYRHCRLLRARRERPHRRAADERDEFAPLHSITSSARASSVGGTSRPSAFAALRLITNSNVVGCCTGRSAGLAPLSILSTYPAARRNRSARLAP